MPDPQPTPPPRRTMVTPTTENLPPSGPAFDARFFDRAEGFGREQLLLIPELESVTIIPTWYSEQNASPFGLIKSRNPQQRQVVEIFRVCQQLNGVYGMQVNLLMQALNQADQYAGQLSRTIDERQHTLAALEGRIAAAQRQLAGNNSSSESPPDAETTPGIAPGPGSNS